MSNKFAFIPMPSSIVTKNGSAKIGEGTTLMYSGDGARQVAERLSSILQGAFSKAKFAAKPFSATKKADAEFAQIVLRAKKAVAMDANGLCDETYDIDVDSAKIEINAVNAAGLARAIETLLQMLPADVRAALRRYAECEIACAKIHDAPTMRWRGMHIDVSRHFFSIEQLKRMIDLAAQHKLNVVHLHLTDDQGWRVEIKKYPKLTKVGAYRDCTLIGSQESYPHRFDKIRYGGFYTQEQLKDLVKFAQERYVTLMPEIDMPGHMQAAVAAYPQLGCTDETVRVRTCWGISRKILNPEQATVDFMKDVLDEIIAIFPSRFIHIGGDEADKRDWADSERCNELMAKRGLRGVDELQSWFVRQIVAHVERRGRRAIGWDEILDGGMSPNAAIMWWRSWNDIYDRALSDGHDMVMAPNGDTYLDHYQREPVSEEPLAIGNAAQAITLGRVYAYRVNAPKESKGKVLGAECLLWSEYIPSSEQQEYMAFPRACAFAETMWSPEKSLKFADFKERLEIHLGRLDAQNVHYCK